MTFKIWGIEDAARASGTDRDAIAMLPNGGYVVTWRENTKIAFQLYDGNGVKNGGVHFVFDGGRAQQFADVTAVGTDGGFAITWTETLTTGGRLLRNQTFNHDGSANTDLTENAAVQMDGAQMAPNGDNGWTTVFVEDISGTNTIRLLQHNALGVPLGSAVSVSTASGVRDPDVAWLGGTKHLVSYFSNGNLSFSIVDGDQVGAATTVSAGIKSDVVALKDPATGALTGAFAVIVDKGATGIEARLYDANGGFVSAVDIAGAKPNSDFDCVSVTALRSGGFALAYIAADASAGDQGDVYVRIVDANGVAGPALKVNARAAVDSFGSQKTPSISETADGRLAVSWNDQTIGNGLTSTTIVDARTTSVTVVGTAHNDVYAPSEHTGDNLDGGEGIDTLTFKGTTTGGVSVNLSTESGSAGDAAGDTYKNFENVIGSKFNDTIAGSTGTNKLEGGAGNDTYSINDTSDVVVETSTGGTADLVYASVSYTLSSYIEKLYASGSGAINLTGNAQANTIKGNAGANKINGGSGNDTLYGGSGKDIFVFSTKPSSSNLDKIADYNVSYDSIYLENAVFTKLGSGSASSPRKLAASAFWKGATAHDASDRIIYDPAKGYLYYDADGTGSSKQVLIATLAKGLKMTYAEFFVI